MRFSRPRPSAQPEPSRVRPRAGRSRRPAAVFLASALAWAAPTAAHAQNPAPGSNGTIGYSMLTSTNPFFITIADSLKAEAAKHGFDVVAVSGDFDANKQHNQVREFVTKGVAAIVLSPCKSHLVGPAIVEANNAGIPVFTCDIKSLAPEGEVVTHIATDNLQGGKLAGEAMIEALGAAGGKVLILHFKQAESCILRVKGFREVVAAHNKGRTSGQINIVMELEGGGVKEKGYAATAEAIQRHPDLSGIFAINDPSGIGAYQALEAENKADQVKIIAFDGQPEGKRAIKDGKIYADPVQFPARIGAATAKAIADYFEGEELPKETLIPSELYRKADADKDPELRD